jgi:hypothetical protein
VHAEQSAAQLQQATQGLGQLLLLAHHYLTLLQQLSPADVAAAAQGGSSSSSSSKGRATGGGDALSRLAAAAQDLEKDRQQLLNSSQLKQQQLDELLAQLLMQTAGRGFGAGQASGSEAVGVGIPAHTSKSPAKHSSLGGRGGALGKLLRGTHSSPAAAPSTAATAAAHGSSVAAVLSNSSSGSTSITPASLVSKLAAGSVGSTQGGDSGGVLSMSAADLPQLQLALCYEIQLLAECGLNALRYIPNITALSSLMQGTW